MARITFDLDANNVVHSKTNCQHISRERETAVMTKEQLITHLRNHVGVIFCHCTHKSRCACPDCKN